ncbi:MAG: hypothetical protein ACPLVJ_00765 [Candidatus Bathyarchaeales archaeon]
MQRYDAKPFNLLSLFINKSVIIQNGDIEVAGILLAFEKSSRVPFHKPFTLVLLTRDGKAIMRDWDIVKFRPVKVVRGYA